tara:strand:+ start:9807 stop:14351 length:4545 start_codon:yes stop_codon:yes gene_type:complete
MNYKIGNKTYSIPDNTPQATVDKIINTLALQEKWSEGGRDNAFQYSADQAQKLYGKSLEAFGRFSGFENVEKYGTEIAEQQDKDLAQGGYKPQYTKSFMDTLDQDGGLAAMGWVGEKLAENSVSGGTAIVGTAATALAALFSTPVAAVLGTGTLIGSAMLGTGEVALETEEKTGSYDEDIALGVGLVIGFLDKFGAGKVIPKDQLAKMTVKQVANALHKKGYVQASKELVKTTLKRGAVEGITESTQDAASMLASAYQGGEYTSDEVKNRLIDSAVIGKVYGSGASLAADTAKGTAKGINKVFSGVSGDGKTKQTSTPKEGATDLAILLKQIAEDNNFDLQDLDKMSQNGARVTVDTAHKHINNYMKNRISDLKTQLKITDLDEFSLVEDKILANIGFEEARNKTKNIVGVKEFESVERLVGHLREGQELIKFMKMSNELSKLHNSGYQKGLSKITDNFSPIGGSVGYDKGAINTEKVLRPIASGGAAITTGGASLLGQLGIVAGGRAIDKLRGVNKSVVDDYIQKNKDGTPIKTIKDPSIRQQAIDEQKRIEAETLAEEQRLLQEENERIELNKQLDQDNAPPAPNSPQFTVEDATGLNKDKVEQVLTILDMTATNPALKRAIASYRNSVRQGGRVQGLTELIRAMNVAITQNNIARDREPNQALNNSLNNPTNQNNQGTANWQNNPNYQRGIADNQALADELIQEADNDTNMPKVDKAKVMATLSTLKKNLGSNPVETAQRVIKDLQATLKDPNSAKYVIPYLERVVGQQGMKTDVNEETITETDEYIELLNPLTAAPKRSVEEIGKILEAHQLEKYGRKLDIVNNEEDFNLVKDELSKQIKYQLDNDPIAGDWYDQDIADTINTSSTVMPELKDPNNKKLLLLLTALTSIGEKPITNFRQGASLALHYFETGNIGEKSVIDGKERIVNPTTGKILGFKGASKEPALRLLDHMVKTMGLEGAMEWLHSTKTKKEIDAKRAEIGLGKQAKILGGMNASVPAVQIFGQKVAPFYLNLNGMNDVTIDLWASRGIRKITGGLSNPLYGKSKNASILIDTPTAAELPTFKRLFEEIGRQLNITPQSAQALQWKYDQTLFNDLGGRFQHEQFSQGAKAFKEKDTVAYEGRHGSTTARDVSSRTIAAEQIESKPPILLTELLGRESGNDSRRNPPSPSSTEINETLPTVEKAFEVGKKGSPHEFGISPTEALGVASALGYIIHLAKDTKTLRKLYGQPIPNDAVLSGFVKHRYNPKTGKVVDKSLVLSGRKSDREKLKRLTGDPDAISMNRLWTKFHEVGHALARQDVKFSSSSITDLGYGRENAKPNIVQTATIEGELASLFNNIMQGTRDGHGRKGTGATIAKEIVELQLRPISYQGDKSKLLIPRYGSFAANIQTKVALKFIAKKYGADSPQYFEAENNHKKWIKQSQGYEQSTTELVADAIAAYMINPQEFKRHAPSTAKFIQDNLNNKPSSKFVKFYGHPLGTILAMFLTALALGEDQEEEEGALSMGQGALSA